MIIEMMPYRHLGIDNSQKAGVQNQIFAVRRGRGYTLHAVLEFTSGTEFWNLRDLGFEFTNSEAKNGFILQGKRAKGRMSLVGIPVRSIRSVNREIQHTRDRLRFKLSHLSDEVDISNVKVDNVVSLTDWKPGA